MAARAKRAVRVDPGAVADRRASAGEREDHDAPPPLHGLRFGEDRSSLAGLPAGERTSFASTSGGPRTRSSTEGASAPRITVNDPFLTLYELEGHRGSFEILLLLYREGTATASRMRQRLGPGQEALDHCLRYLLKVGFIRLSQPLAFPFARNYSLTERGKDLVETPIHSWSAVLGP